MYRHSTHRLHKIIWLRAHDLRWSIVRVYFIPVIISFIAHFAASPQKVIFILQMWSNLANRMLSHGYKYTEKLTSFYDNYPQYNEKHTFSKWYIFTSIMQETWHFMKNNHFHDTELATSLRNAVFNPLNNPNKHVHDHLLTGNLPCIHCKCVHITTTASTVIKYSARPE
jgi:hypothetical protein